MINPELYDFELEKLSHEIKRTNAKRLLVQLPDGIKPHANKILDIIKNEFPQLHVVFWAGSCYGACDAPLHVQRLGFDLLVQFGHAPWRY